MQCIIITACDGELVIWLFWKSLWVSIANVGTVEHVVHVRSRQLSKQWICCLSFPFYKKCHSVRCACIVLSTHVCRHNSQNLRLCQQMQSSEQWGQVRSFSSHAATVTAARTQFLACINVLDLDAAKWMECVRQCSINWCGSSALQSKILSLPISWSNDW